MVNITFIEPQGERKSVQADEGLTIMEVAVRNGIAGIAAECGGQCSCATCHVYIDDAFLIAVGVPGDDEADMLDFSDKKRPNSRLGCQVEVVSQLDGMTVEVAGDEG